MGIDMQRLRELLEVLKDDSAEGRHFDAAHQVINALPALLETIERLELSLKRARCTVDMLKDRCNRRAATIDTLLLTLEVIGSKPQLGNDDGVRGIWLLACSAINSTPTPWRVDE